MFNYGWNSNFNQSPTGTLQSQGMYYQPPMPNIGTPGGTGVADNRAYTRSVQGNELVSNQMNNLENQNSQYMQNARRRGLETANSRGMLNSSIAAGASQRSALEAAMPIAQADAASYGRAASENLGYMNDNLMQERQIANQVLMEREGLANSRYNADLAANTQRYGIDIGLLGDRENRAYGGEQQGLDRAFQYGMSNLSNNQQLQRMGYGNQLDQGNMMLGATLGDWSSGQNWRREMYGNLSQLAVGGPMAMQMGLLQQMYDNPDMYPPEVIQGLTNFTNDVFANFDMTTFNNIINQVLGGGGG